MIVETRRWPGGWQDEPAPPEGEMRLWGRRRLVLGGRLDPGQTIEVHGEKGRVLIVSEGSVWLAAIDRKRQRMTMIRRDETGREMNREPLDLRRPHQFWLSLAVKWDLHRGGPGYVQRFRRRF